MSVEATVGAEAPAVARRLFGTDGVRGRAGELLTPELAMALGRSAIAAAADASARVLIVRDTRESGQMLEAALAAGVAAAGATAVIAGVLPTPAAALLVRRYGFDLGVVISASHNPYYDNGIKFFGSDGTKLADADELAIESALNEPGRGASDRPGRIQELRGAAGDYLRELELRFRELELTQRVLLDCANGATYAVAPEIFRRLGARVDVIASEPDGRNINDGCGSTHVERLAERIVDDGYDAGFGFDGDGDRVLAVDRTGTIVDGDELIALAARHLRAAGRLLGDGVAVTVMTNFGFHQAMRSLGIEVAVTPVGDRAVLAELLGRGWALGGEQSGHIIDMNFVPSGDGVAAALLTLEALDGSDLSERDAMAKLPQRLVNVIVSDRDSLDSAGPVWDAVREAEAELDGRGRVLIRPSGTEPLVRVMVEAPGDDECRRISERLVAVVESELGGR